MHHGFHSAALGVALAGALAACGGTTPPPATSPAVPPQAISPAPAPATGTVPPAPGIPPAATVSGRITSQRDNTPIARARVVLSATGIAESRVAITGPDGAFRFDRLPSATYAIAVTCTGFAPAAYGERRLAPPLSLAVSEGQAVTGVDIALEPAGVIAGQVLDEDERPFAGATVEALVSRTAEGRTGFVSVALTQSDDRGNFRLIGIPAGQYYVSAFDPAFANAGDETGALRYTPTYYPGVPFAEEATRVTVAAGVEPEQRIVFRLQIVRPARVAGVLRTQDGRQLTSGAVVMAQVRGEGLSTVPTQDVVILPDGSFAFGNVPPGQYQIRARGDVEADGVTRFATFRIRVEGRDVDNIDLVLIPGARIHGRIVVEGTPRAKPPAWAGVRVRAPFFDGRSFGDTLDGQVQPDASYGIHGVMAGRHALDIEGLPYPWVVKAVTWQGRDITDTGIEANNLEEYTDIRIVITDVATELTGAVRDSRGAPVPDAIVLIIPSASEFWTRMSRRFAVVRSDAGGRYRVRGLPAGEYRAVASLEIDEGDAYLPDLLKALAPAGTPISLAERAALTVNLPLTPIRPAEHPAAR
jgi:hypothetical protein